ncbi:hypothetical protein WAI453_001476 [Rhynchosporium graminicola]
MRFSVIHLLIHSAAITLVLGIAQSGAKPPGLGLAQSYSGISYNYPKVTATCINYTKHRVQSSFDLSLVLGNHNVKLVNETTQ